ncbi:hypothetical protein [Campylobacter sp.]|uniref:hypothetical protein n=1 Tax=Campylobacter sp. TaxID=205 RepID=UPI002AA6C0DA|nr:hypothetical protein [Campylobacter sp.]MCI7581763.1 hypothetical protein [Campylobacter sp.]
MRLLPLFSKPRNDEENSRIPKINSRILKLEFPRLCHCPPCVFCVIPRLDRGISSQINLEF